MKPHIRAHTRGLFGARPGPWALNTASDPHLPCPPGGGTGQLFPVDAQAVLMPSARPREGPELDRKEPTRPLAPEEGGMGQSPVSQTEGPKPVPLRTAGQAREPRPQGRPGAASLHGRGVVPAMFVQRQWSRVLGGHGGLELTAGMGSSRCPPRAGTQQPAGTTLHGRPLVRPRDGLGAGVVAWAPGG